MATRPSDIVYCKCILILFAGVLVASCARHEIKLHAVSYNKAISDFGNKQVLVNAVRASKRFPMYFSAVGAMQGQDIVNGSVAGRFPFTKRKIGGPGGRGSQWELNSFNLDPTVNIRSGLSQIAIGNLNTKQFQTQLYTEMSAEVFQRFYDNNIARSLLFSLFVHKITLPKKLDLALGNGRVRLCQHAQTRSGAHYACNRIDAYLARYESEGCGQYRSGRGNSGYFNDPDDLCDFLEFQLFVTELRALKFFVTPDKVSEGGLKPTEETETTFEGLIDPEFKSKDKKYEKISDVKKTVVVKKPKAATFTTGVAFPPWAIERYIQYPVGAGGELELDLRSPYAMIEYLGGLIRAQLFRPGNERFRPEVSVGRFFDQVPLFVVREGAIGATVSAAISVRHENRVYYVPRPNYGKSDEARSLQVIDLISQVIALQIDEKALPKTSSIKLVD